MRNQIKRWRVGLPNHLQNKITINLCLLPHLYDTFITIRIKRWFVGTTKVMVCRHLEIVTQDFRICAELKYRHFAPVDLPNHQPKLTTEKSTTSGCCLVFQVFGGMLRDVLGFYARVPPSNEISKPQFIYTVLSKY